MKKTKLKVNDHVIVIAGKSKGKTGKITQILPDLDKVVVEGVNIMYKHIKSRRKGEKGQRVEFNGPLHLSNVMLLCPKTNKATRVGMKVNGDKSKSRLSKKANEVID